MSKFPICLTIAGSDSGGGAGIQADLKTFSALGTFGCSVITALTAQNTQTVSAVDIVSKDMIAAQLHAVFTDLDIASVKIGMLADQEVISVVAEILNQYQPRYIVLDPVMIAKSGDRLLADDAIEALRNQLIPQAHLITPNLPEAAALLGEQEASDRDGMHRQLEQLAQIGATNVLLKGGHLPGALCSDLLWKDGTVHTHEHPRIQTHNTHGTGCTLSSAIAALLARGFALEQAVSESCDYVHGAILGADSLEVGAGHGPLMHFYRSWNAT